MEAVELFRKLTTQWIVGVGGLIGLNYQSLEFVLRLYKKKKWRELFEDIREIEAGVLEAIHRLNEKAGERGA